MVTLLSWALAFIGFTMLALSMDRHHGQVFGGFGGAAHSTPLQVAGWTLLVLSLVLLLDARGFAWGATIWTGLLTMAAIPLILMLTYAPKLLARPFSIVSQKRTPNR